MTDPTPSSSRLLKISGVFARWLTRLVLGLWVVFALAWGALHVWIVPRIGDFRPQLESAASRALGVPVRMGTVTARSAGWIPSFELGDVALLDPQGREALHLARVLAAVSPRSLWSLGFEQLVIERPALDVRRTADGRILVAGLDLSGSAGGPDSPARDWFFAQTEVVVRGGTLNWTDEQRDGVTLALTDVDLVVRNSARRHQIRLDATPPDDWGGRFQLAGQFRRPLLSRHPGRWQDWTGQLYADLPRADVSQLRRYADLGVEIRTGRGALRAWVDVGAGQFTGALADLSLHEVSATLGPGLAPLALDDASGRLGWRQLAGGFEFFTQGLQFRTAEGLRWPGGNVFLTYTAGEGRMPAQGELRADRLDLAALTQVADRLPLGTPTHAALSAHPVKGVVDAVQAKWQGRLDALSRYEARGRVSGLEIAGVPSPSVPASTATHPPAGIPGVRGATVDFNLTQAGGTAHLAVADGAIELPGVLEDPQVPLDRLAADVQWQLDGDHIAVQLTNVRFANADVDGEARASWKTSDPARSPGHSRFPGVLDLQGTASRANGARVFRYLPLGIPAETRQYVRDAVTQADASGVKFTVRGDLAQVPFVDPRQGEFRISLNVSNATLAYVPAHHQAPGVPAWPPLRQLAGELVFDRAAMFVRGGSARLENSPGVQLSKVETVIANMQHSPTVVVTANALGPLTEMLTMVTTSPLRDTVAPALGQTIATGNADLQLRLALPLHDLNQSRVQGSVTLAGNDVQFSPQSPQLGSARGRVMFSDAGFTVPGVTARLYGGEVRIEGGTRPAANGVEAQTVLRAQGSLTAEGLRAARELEFPSRLAQSASGATTYTAVLTQRRGATDFTLASSLEGMALSLPAPLAKSAELALPLRLAATQLAPAPVTPDGPPVPHDQLQLALGRVAAITYVRDVSGPQARVVRGSIAVGLATDESAPLPDAGVVANVNLDVVDIDAWDRVLSRATGTPLPPVGTAAPAPVTPAAPTLAAAPATVPVLAYLPNVLAVRARELVAGGRRLHNVVVGGSRDGRVWRANVDATELNGYVEYRQSTGAGAGRVLARLARLNITQGAATEVENLLDDQPTNIPALDIVVEDFELSGKALGRVEIDAVNRGAGVAGRESGVREWRLNRLAMTLPEASFEASGNWAEVSGPGARARPAQPGAKVGAKAGEQRRMAMNFKLNIADSGALLARFGKKDVVRRGKGVMAGQVGWIGSPFAIDYPTMTGEFNVNMESGQFLKADPGLAKLLGVLSLQSLPRRFTLDFRDVFSEGFAFDFVRGDVRIEQGVASTNNLQMKGVNAAVLMEGRADIAHETQDLRVVVVPEISAGTAALAAAVINPAIGLGAFLAQWFLSRPLAEAATREFQIDGTWVDPKVTRVERKARTPAATPAEGTPP